MIKVSVVMGVYNGAEYLSCTLQSVIEQTLKDIEIILVDDGSNPETKSIIESFAGQDNRITVLTKATNEGLTKALIDGCKLAKGQYIARIDNGDVMVPNNRLEQQAAFLENNLEYVLVSGGMLLVDLVSHRAYTPKQSGRSDTEIRKALKAKKTAVSHVTVMMSKFAYENCGGYNAAMRTGQDTDLWPRLLETGKGITLDAVFAIATMRNDSISVARNNEQYSQRIKVHLKAILKGDTSLQRIKELVFCSLKRVLPLSLRLYLMRRKNYNLVRQFPRDIDDLNQTWKWYLDHQNEIRSP